MNKVMHHIKVNTDKKGDLVLLQELNDINEHDPKITISADQATLVASWIMEASQEQSDPSAEPARIPVRFWIDGQGPDNDELDIYNNDSGMVVINFSNGAFIEISPVMAKRMREQLSKAITLAHTDMLKSDEEI